jgi:hypothetical protein
MNFGALVGNKAYESDIQGSDGRYFSSSFRFWLLLSPNGYQRSQSSELGRKGIHFQQHADVCRRQDTHMSVNIRRVDFNTNR